MTTSTMGSAARCNAPRFVLELRAEPQTDRTRPAGHDVDVGADAARDEPRQLVALVEDVRREKLEVVIAPNRSLRTGRPACRTNARSFPIELVVVSSEPSEPNPGGRPGLDVGFARPMSHA